MMIRPLALRPQLALGDWAADGAPGSSSGRLNCIPWPIAQVPAWETWKIDVIHLNNWGADDAIYSLTIEKETYDRAAVPAANPGLRFQGAFDPNGSATIRWGEHLPAGKPDRILGPFILQPKEWFCGAAIPGLGNGLINCHAYGWRFS